MNRPISIRLALSFREKVYSYRLFVNMSNTEYQAVIKLFSHKELSITEITKELADIYSDSAPSYRTAAKWVAELKVPAPGFEDALRSGRSPTPVADESIRAVEESVMRDKQISARYVADALAISKTLPYEIISTMRRFILDGYRHFNVTIASTVVKNFWKIATKIQMDFLVAS